MKTTFIEYRPTLRQAIKQWGKDAQIDMLHEEIGELLQAINKHKRKGTDETITNLIEEIADVEILLEQLKLMINGHAGVEVFKIEKLQRLQKRLDKDDFELND